MTKAIFFILGAGVGVIATRAYFKNKYEKEKEEEIKSVKEVFAKRKEAKEKEAREKAEIAKDKPSVTDYANLLRKKRYDAKHPVTAGFVEPVESNPCVIPPDEFGEIEEYEKLSLTYYADKVLCDSDDEIVDNVDFLIGPDALDSFGEWEDDSVFVRNDELKCYYEILLSLKTYSEVLTRRPREG